MNDKSIAGRRANVLGVHSIDHFALAVPDLEDARRFYSLFGLDVRESDGGLHLFTQGNLHRWGVITQGAGAKQLRYLSFGVYADEMDAFAAHLDACGVTYIDAPTSADTQGIWFSGFDGLPINIRPADKATPAEKSHFSFASAPPGQSGAILNSQAPKVHPRRLSHFAIFTTDVNAAITYYEKTLGLRLSDKSEPGVAFLHGVHGSDHHLLALVLSDRRGMHHNSWDVGSVMEVGLGGSTMARAGYGPNWGVGQHVLGANYFYYVRDPWGSFSEYSADIDFIPHDVEWPSANHAPEDSMFLWGPDPFPEFIQNTEPTEADLP
ncbi:VOC family protein [Sphingobium sp. Ant17]|uniref:VOC family protein n=1 Tax=Sphingobium sp. Ant17 TaxID=1461752 RepID=UPI00044728D9|nr:VOC family protein [Sphingobium sp. Ant17]EXS70943.1 metapyrocatechase [Sphingobium sp. Ant17]OHC92352.1 MAG: metapyrocatechase [Sphingomonadales bacterium GWF1_63_6]OHC97012.1 MAG: metapyrocatechase [Sphingomonadales bacterium RIFCSPLOWO2_12_FULL_63_15]|tara:strand:- start:8879 stop:9844 length:966 start_codon:yes stop_codon:yes gene_type:complete